jgi:DNA-binding NarL/FixJ family response regulator
VPPCDGFGTPGRPATSVLIVDDHALVGVTLAQRLLGDGLEASYCAAHTTEKILAEAAEMRPGLALLDLDLGHDREGNRIDGACLIAPLQAAGWRVLVLSGSVDAARIGAALDAGALAWVPKRAPFPALLRTLLDTAAGHEAMPAARRQRFIEVHRARVAETRRLTERLDRLTQRERAVLAELARGHRAQAIAELYVVSLETVRTQIKSILTKLDVGSQLEAVALYMKVRR